jgi:hypothetical protein
VTSEGLRLAGLLDVDLDLDFLAVSGQLIALARGHVLGGLFGVGAGLLQLLAHLLEGHHPVFLAPHVQRVDAFFVEIDDLSGAVSQLRLAGALDGHGRGLTIAGGRAAPHAHDAAEHAFELDLDLLPRPDVGTQRRAEGGENQQERNEVFRAHVDPPEGAILFL